MDVETIDLTDPLEQLCKQYGMSPELALEKLELIKKGSNIEDINKITLTDSSKTNQSNETISLSSDDEDNPPNESVELLDDDEDENSEPSEKNDITEVKIIQCYEEISQGNSEDDEFFEESSVQNEEEVDDAKSTDEPPALRENGSSHLQDETVSKDTDAYCNIESAERSEEVDNAKSTDEPPALREKGLSHLQDETVSYDTDAYCNIESAERSKMDRGDGKNETDSNLQQIESSDHNVLERTTKDRDKNAECDKFDDDIAEQILDYEDQLIAAVDKVLPENDENQAAHKTSVEKKQPENHLESIDNSGYTAKDQQMESEKDKCDLVAKSLSASENEHPEMDMSENLSIGDMSDTENNDLIQNIIDHLNSDDTMSSNNFEIDDPDDHVNPVKLNGKENQVESSNSNETDADLCDIGSSAHSKIVSDLPSENVSGVDSGIFDKESNSGMDTSADTAVKLSDENDEDDIGKDDPSKASDIVDELEAMLAVEIDSYKRECATKLTIESDFLSERHTESIQKRQTYQQSNTIDHEKVLNDLVENVVVSTHITETAHTEDIVEKVSETEIEDQKAVLSTQNTNTAQTNDIDREQSLTDVEKCPGGNAVPILNEESSQNIQSGMQIYEISNVLDDEMEDQTNKGRTNPQKQDNADPNLQSDNPKDLVNTDVKDQIDNKDISNEQKLNNSRNVETTIIDELNENLGISTQNSEPIQKGIKVVANEDIKPENEDSTNMDTQAVLTDLNEVVSKESEQSDSVGNFVELEKNESKINVQVDFISNEENVKAFSKFTEEMRRIDSNKLCDMVIDEDMRKNIASHSEEIRDTDQNIELNTIREVPTEIRLEEGGNVGNAVQCNHSSSEADSLTKKGDSKGEFVDDGKKVSTEIRLDEGGNVGNSVHRSEADSLSNEEIVEDTGEDKQCLQSTESSKKVSAETDMKEVETQLKNIDENEDLLNEKCIVINKGVSVNTLTNQTDIDEDKIKQGDILISHVNPRKSISRIIEKNISMGVKHLDQNLSKESISENLDKNPSTELAGMTDTLDPDKGCENTSIIAACISKDLDQSNESPSEEVACAGLDKNQECEETDSSIIAASISKDLDQSNESLSEEVACAGLDKNGECEETGSPDKEDDVPVYKTASIGQKELHSEVDSNEKIKNDLEHNKNIQQILTRNDSVEKNQGVSKDSEATGFVCENEILDDNNSNKQADDKSNVAEGSDDERQNDVEFQSPQDPEEVRKNLWLQLTSLRSRKNTGALMGNRLMRKPPLLPEKNQEEPIVHQNVEDITVESRKTVQAESKSCESRDNDKIHEDTDRAKKSDADTTQNEAVKSVSQSVDTTQTKAAEDKAQVKLTETIKSILSDEMNAGSQQSDENHASNENNCTPNCVVYDTSVDSEKRNQNDLRKNLKLQFSNRKYSEPSATFEIVKNRTTEIASNAPKKTLKVKYTEEIPGPSWLDRPFRSISNDEHFSSIRENKNNEPGQQSTDFGFVIQSVTSVADKEPDPDQSDSVTREPISQNSESMKSKSDMDESEVPNILSELRKIISKSKNSKNKKLPVAESERRLPDAQTPNSKPDKTSNSSLQLQSGPKNSNPFESNALDEFLTENSKLRVSYDVPKSGAEEGLTRNYTEEELLIPVYVKEDTNDDYPEKAKGEPKIRARTLAEKRRLYEKNQKKLAREEEKAKRLTQNSKKCYVLFEDQKIFVKSHLTSKCLAEINSTREHPETKTEDIKNTEGPRKLAPTTPRKQSLLRELFERDKPNVKYKAGPLSKKPQLQEGLGSWVTELKVLPKVMLEIEGQFGKPVHEDVLHLMPQSDGDISIDQVEFALAALVTKDEPKSQSYSFVVPYRNNQTQILVRRRQELVVIKDEFDGKDVKLTTEEEVANVVNDLVDYVELKELASSLIKEDEDCNYLEEEPVNPRLDEDKPSFSVKRRFGRKKSSKTNTELRRLNCKVVEVEVDQPTVEDHSVCVKPFCKLGCVCKSLSGDSLIGLHCGKLNCMFGCKCPKENDKIHTFSQIKFPAGTDLFSTDTVSRIEDEAKRHLAKVERDFTQTIIQTGGQTIVVGFGNKPRRVTRAPKKYVDYVDDPEEYYKSSSKMEILKRQIKPCRVEIEKFNFTDIMPYCLVHNLYNCYCKGRFKFINPESPEDNFVSTEKTKPSLSNKAARKEKLENKRANKIQNRKIKSLVQKFHSERLESPSPDKNSDTDQNVENEISYSSSGRPLRQKKKNYKNDFYGDYDHVIDKKEKDSNRSSETDNIPEIFESARTKPIDRKYKKIKEISDRLFERDFVKNITQADLLKINLDKEGLSDCELLKISLIADERRRLNEMERLSQNEMEKLSKIRKRKQVLQTREEDIIKLKKTRPFDIRPKVKSVFEGEIIVNDEAWLERFARNTKQQMDGYARILPWKAMLKGFLSKTLTVNCILDLPFRLVLTLGMNLLYGALNVETDAEEILKTRFPTKNSWCVGQMQNVKNIVKWLTDCSLPEKYNETSVSFLLVEIKENQFEVRGLCTQSTNARKKFESSSPNPNVPKSPYSNRTSASPEQLSGVRRRLSSNLSSTPPSIQKSSNIYLSPASSEHPSVSCNKSSTSCERRLSTTNSTASNDREVPRILVSDDEVDKEEEAPMEEPAPLDESSVENEAQVVKHRDSDGKVRMLYLTRETYPLQELVEGSSTSTSIIDVTSALYMWVSLPQIFKVGKWKMIFLTEDFAYLYFKDIKYSIKYVDLVKFTEFAKEFKCTLVLKNKELTSAYAHINFGIYVDQNYSDRIFIGPYFKLFSREDVDTLRYDGDYLIQSHYQCGHWLIERSSINSPKNNVQATIDLTEEDEIENSTLSTQPQAVQSKPAKKQPTKQRKRMNQIENDTTLVSSASTVDITKSPDSSLSLAPSTVSISPEDVQSLKEDHIIYHKGTPINIKSSRPKAPSEYNRFIITNIPGFGYLGAYQPENSTSLEVSWPFEKKVLVFADGNQATDFLLERFSQLLQPVPETFKIYVMLLKDLQLDSYQPVNSDFLTGHCICGPLGIYNFRTLTDEFCRDVLNMSKESITLLFARRAQSYIKKKVEELAEVVNLSKAQIIEKGVPGILASAVTEIKFHETRRIGLLSEIEIQEKLAVDNMKKLYNLMSELPAQERILQCKIFKSTLNIRPQRTVSSEVVEIIDDDEECVIDSGSTAAGENTTDNSSRVGSIILPNTAPEDDVIITPRISSVTSLAMEVDTETHQNDEVNSNHKAPISQRSLLKVGGAQDSLMKTFTQLPLSQPSLLLKTRKMLIDDDSESTEQQAVSDPAQSFNISDNSNESITYTSEYSVNANTTTSMEPNRVGSIILPNTSPEPEEEEVIPAKKPKPAHPVIVQVHPSVKKFVNPSPSVIKIGNMLPTHQTVKTTVKPRSYQRNDFSGSHVVVKRTNKRPAPSNPQNSQPGGVLQAGSAGNPTKVVAMNGLKIMRTTDGKYVVVSDKLTNPPPPQTTVTNLVIQNNQIISSETYVKPSQ